MVSRKTVLYVQVTCRKRSFRMVIKRAEYLLVLSCNDFIEETYSFNVDTWYCLLQMHVVYPPCDEDFALIRLSKKLDGNNAQE